MQETGVQSLSQEDPMEKEMATHSHILAWKIPWTEEQATVHGVTNRVRYNWVTKQPPWYNPQLRVKRYKYFIATFQKSKIKYSRLGYLWGRDHGWRREKNSVYIQRYIIFRKYIPPECQVISCLNSATEEAKAYTYFYVKALLLWFRVKTIAKFWGLK